MHPALPLQPLHGLADFPLGELLDYLLQSGVPLPHDLVQLGRTHAGILQLRERPAGLDGLMLASVAHQQHAVVWMKTGHEIVHLLGRGE